MSLRLLLTPAGSDVFTGRADEIRFFQRFVSDVKAGAETKRAVLISGIPGIGKSSLLGKFRSIAEVEGVTVIPLKVSLSEARFFFEEVKRRLDSLAPGARKRIMGEKPLVVPPPLPKEFDAAFEGLFMERFMEDMDRVGALLSKPVFLFCDSFERFSWLGYTYAYAILRRVLSAFSERGFPAFFVLAADGSVAGDIVRDAGNLFHVLNLEPMPTSDMRVLVQKLSEKLSFKVDEKTVEELVKDSGGIPHKLCLLIYSLLATSEASDITSESLRRASELLQENPLESIFRVTGDEAFIVNRIVSGEFNFAPLDSLKASLGELLDEAVSSLKEKGLIDVEDSFVLIVSDALFHDLRLSFNVDQVYGRANILLKLIFKSARSGTPIDEAVFNWFRDSATMLAARKIQTFIVELASGVEDAAKEALERGLFYDASCLFNLAADLYRRLGDYERAGMVLDSASKFFADAGKLHYARLMLTQASEFYEKAGVEWRAHSSSRSAARMFENAGDEYFSSGALMLSRVFYRRAVEYLMKAGDRARALSLCEKALNAFRGVKTLERDFLSFKEKLEVEKRGEAEA